MTFLFEKLEVYQRAVEFASSINALCLNGPKGNYQLTDQLRRASISIPANIAEGSGRYHKAEKRNFYYIARGSAYECVPLLKIALDCSFISDEQYEQRRLDLLSLVKMVTKLEQSVGNR